MKVAAEVTDHAVLRYLQRVHNVDVELYRRHILGLVQTGVETGASAVVVEGVRFVIRDGSVTTVLPKISQIAQDRYARRNHGRGEDRHDDL